MDTTVIVDRRDRYGWRAAAAARRAASARRRSELLDQQLHRLRDGRAGASPADIDVAEDHLWNAVEESERARDRLSLAYACAAEVHERAAQHFLTRGREAESEKHRVAAVLGRIESDIV